MSLPNTENSRVIQIANGVIGPVAPRCKTIKVKETGDFPTVSRPYLEIARHYASPLLMGPPICDELIALVQHMFTEEEALLVQHLKPFKRKTAAALAKIENISVEQVQSTLERMANEKHILMSFGSTGNKYYMIMPLVGGTFELVQMGTEVGTPGDTLFTWRRRFAELYEALFKTGYGVDYAKASPSLLRSLPIGKSIDAHPMALPSDKVEGVIDRYKRFAVGRCGCRMTKRHLNEDCGRPMETCAAMGDMVETSIQKGELLARQGTEGSDFTFIVEGKAWVEKDGKIINYLSAGDFFGEISLIDGKPRAASVIAETDMTLLVVDANSFNHLLDTVPDMTKNILVSLCSYLRRTENSENE